MTMLVVVIAAWLSANFDLPLMKEPPVIKTITTTQMVAFRYGGGAAAGARELVAIYDDRTRTIYLPDRWSAKGPAEVSVLVHEMVHHLQNVAHLTYECPAAREALAYAAQEKWLGLFGKNLATEFGVDRATLKLTTACLH